MEKKVQPSHQTPYKPHQEHNGSELSDTSDELTNLKRNKTRFATPYKPKQETSHSSDDEELGSSHREIFGSWKKGGSGELENYDEQTELARSNSDRKYGEFAEIGDAYENERISEPTQSGGKPIPQGFKDRYLLFSLKPLFLTCI